MKKNLKIFLFTAMILSLVVLPLISNAATIQESVKKNLTELATGAGFKEETTLPEIVGLIINVFLSILGVIFVVLMVYGGYLWMTSYGNSTKVDKAKGLIVDAILGLIIILAAYAISNFVVLRLIGATTQ